MEVISVVGQVDFVSRKEEPTLSRLSFGEQSECLVQIRQDLVGVGYELLVLNQLASAALGDNRIDAQKNQQSDKSNYKPCSVRSVHSGRSVLTAVLSHIMRVCRSLSTDYLGDGCRQPFVQFTAERSRGKYWRRGKIASKDPMKRLGLLAFTFLLALSTSAQWANPEQKEVPAFNAAAPKSGTKLPPLLAGDQLKTPMFRYPFQARAYEAAARNSKLIYQLPCYCYCDRSQGHNSLHSCFEGTHGANCATCIRRRSTLIRWPSCIKHRSRFAKESNAANSSRSTIRIISKQSRVAGLTTKEQRSRRQAKSPAFSFVIPE